MLPKCKYIAFFVSCVVSGAVCSTESILDSAAHQGDFGGVGLLQMPTARMARLENSVLTMLIMINIVGGLSSAQPFDWFEATLRI